MKKQLELIIGNRQQPVNWTFGQHKDYLLKRMRLSTEDFPQYHPDVLSSILHNLTLPETDERELEDFEDELIKPYGLLFVDKYRTLPIYFKQAYLVWKRYADERPHMCGHLSPRDGYAHSAISIRKNLGKLHIIEPFSIEEYAEAIHWLRESIVVATEGLSKYVVSRYNFSEEETFLNPLDRIALINLVRLLGTECKNAKIDLSKLRISNSQKIYNLIKSSTSKDFQDTPLSWQLKGASSFLEILKSN